MDRGHEGAAQVVAWMMRDGRHMTHMREFGDEMCRRIVAAGIPIWRAFCTAATLHPQISGTAYVWRRDQAGAARITATHAFQQSEEVTSSPIAAVRKTARMIRRKLHDPDCAFDYPVLLEFKNAGGTDYAAMPMTCSSGEVNCISWATDRAGGFTDQEIEGLTEVAEALAIIVELQSTRRIARHLMDT